ncbi:MAG: Asp-tRNA(Asn)/Glu-tRNA(Gln) amidotransferase subunit GatB [Chloroflexi bacterium]|nr:Asp-tRNA(Asn)/Glu-tRNA(Gln) amidotransferase subunit GatB [Chloroflexota bacterium]MDA1145761.1 Asp-tRNA(Asn)/Glu-tRNA(Gln) amidotransferase subunit GatB [Chloroflexota bacterium]
MTTTAAAPTDKYEVVIGLEVHCQLRTRSKMFSDCPRDYFDKEPNTLIDPVTLGLPGTLPVINEQAVSYTILAGLALGCTIPEFAKFDRKNYPYPDLPKGYQITQFDQPFCVDGDVEVETEGRGKRTIQLERIHLEEDTGRLLHRNNGSEDYSLIDFNRAGVPLMELVSKPDLRSSDEAVAFLRYLRQVFRYTGVSDADLEKGSFRCDANVSLRLYGAEELGAKVEVKNMNSFRSVQRAIEFEIVRQAAILDAGGTIDQETRGFVDASGETASQRSKEGAHDYRYFPEPDLPPLHIAPAMVEELRAALPELPRARAARFEGEHGLTLDEAQTLTETRQRADDYEAAVTAVGDPTKARAVAHWFIGDVAGRINEVGRADAELADTGITPEHVAQLVRLVEAGTITASTAKDVLGFAFDSGDLPEAIVEARGLKQVTDSGAIDAVITQVIEANPKAVEDYRGGKDSAVKFLVGQVMREIKGRTDPNSAAELIKAALDA